MGGIFREKFTNRSDGKVPSSPQHQRQYRHSQTHKARLIDLMGGEADSHRPASALWRGLKEREALKGRYSSE
jgi:hypothetical protein